MSSPSSAPRPESILIIGAGVFGLSTAHTLLSCPEYDDTDLTILDAYAPSPSGPSTEPASLPTASLDASRIIRPDYANAAYAVLAARAQEHWRAGWPLTLESSSTQALPDGQRPTPPYHESSLLLTAYASNAAGGAYVDGSLANVLGLEAESKPLKRTKRLDTPGQVREALGTGGCTGARGYVNPNSGWADAEGAMKLLRQRVWRAGEKRGRVRWVRGEARELVYSKREKSWTVVGAKLKNGEEIRAAVTILAAGAWSPALLPRSLGSRVKARGQVLAYVNIDREEQERYGGLPVALELSGGMFVIFPRPVEKEQAASENVHVKVARHGWGYSHRVRVDDTEPTNDTLASHDPTNQVLIDLPAPVFSPIPAEGQAACRAFLAEAVPSLKGRPFSNTRLCWYADTGTGDFIIDWVPEYGSSLLVATGGSGHGFKFIPVIGDLTVKKLEGRLGSKISVANGATGTTGEGGLETQLAHLWRWRTNEEVEEEWHAGKRDGSRGGQTDMIWEKEMDNGPNRTAASSKSSKL